jgi:CheY-like chemotaxis protein
MIKLLAELHGGRVAVQSAKDEGSRFTVWLPWRSNVAATSEFDDVILEVPLIEIDPSTRVALVVEDDDKSAELVRLQLEAEGFTVVHANTAETGLAIAAKYPLALITLDIMLPGMDGWEFLSRIKQLPNLSTVPVVIISIVSDVDKGMSLGAAAVMQKPVSRQAMYMSLLQLGLLPASEHDTIKVLLVDDDPIAIELVAQSMADFTGITLLRAEGGESAIAIARSELPDLILLDLLMPDVSGFEVVEALRDDPATRDISIIILTAKTLSEADRHRLNGFVTKVVEKSKFDSARFITEVRRAMSRHQLSGV